MTRQTQVRRRLRYRRSRCRPVRVVARTRRHTLVYRGRIWGLVLMLVLVAAAFTVGTVLGHLALSTVTAGLAVGAWLWYGMRITRFVPAGPRGDGPAPPGGASVREPRRPLPLSPAGAAARPRDEDESPGQAVALA
jgi:hypothetical protein